jgi:outer membrane immunogenic protein
MLRRILLASAGAMALSGAAMAADLTRPPPPPVYVPPVPPPLWNGFYIGLNAGGTWSSSNNINTIAFPGPCDPASGLGCSLSPNYSTLSAIGATFSVPVSTSGFIGGGQLGYNYQFANNWVVGIEADIQGIAGSHKSASVFTTVPSPNFPAQPLLSVDTASRSIDYLGTLRGRIGFLATPTFLLYGTGGLAYGGVRLNTSIVQSGPGLVFLGVPSSFGSASTTRVGWTAGGGVEWMFLPNWSLKVEYLYYDIGNLTNTPSPIVGLNGVAPVGSVFMTSFPRTTTRFNGNIVRAGINYHFNWLPAPVVAKY